MTDDRLFPLPLFHGTSTWFLEDIIRHGIGGFDVHERLRSREFLAQVWELRLELASEDERSTLLAWPGSMIAHMTGDRVSAGGFNFRYGQFYCTADECKAVSYATNAFGSELVSEGAKLLAEIRSAVPERAEKLLAGYAEIERCLAFDHQPVVIRLDGVERSAMLSEDGQELRPDEEEIAHLLAFEVRPNARYSSLSIFRAENVEFDDIGVRSYGLVPLRGER